MLRTTLLPLALLVGLAGCVGLPELDSSTISKVPANAKAFGLAKRAVNICSSLPDADKMFQRFEAVGYKRVKSGYTLRSGEEFYSDVVTAQDGDMRLKASAGGCEVALENMTPDQSHALAAIWAKRFSAKTNAELDQGLSNLVVQAWRTPLPDQMVFVSAYKTWSPWGAFAPKGPGASVTLRFVDR